MLNFGQNNIKRIVGLPGEY